MLYSCEILNNINMNSNQNIVAQITTEFLEVAVHNVLKIREIYPDSIYVKKQKYGVVVYQCIHPQLKEYITNSLKAVYNLAKEDKFEKLVICFMRGFDLQEKLVFDFSGMQNILEEDPFLLNIEKTFSSFFCRLHSLNEYLYPLSNDVTFALQIHTTENAGVTYMENPAFQNFPWMQIGPSLSEIQGGEIIPLDAIDNESMERIQIYMEKKI